MKKLLLTTVALGAASVAFGAEPGKVLYELVPNIVVPDTISYKPSAKSQDAPSSFGMSSNYPATYVPYPSYYLPYPTAFRPIQQVIYPITTLPDDASFAPAAAQPEVPVQPTTVAAVQVQLQPMHQLSVPQTSVIASVERKQNSSTSSPIRLVSATEADVASCEGSDAHNAATSILQTASAWSFSSPIFKVASIPTPAIGGQASTLSQSGKYGSTQLNVPPGVYDIPLPYHQCSFGTRCGDMAPHHCPVRTMISQKLQAKKQQEQQTYQMQMQYYMQQQQGQQPGQPQLQQMPMPAGGAYPAPLPVQGPAGSIVPLTPPASSVAAAGAITPAGLFAPRSAAPAAPMVYPYQMNPAMNPAANPANPNGAATPQVMYTVTPVMTPYGMAMVMQPQWTQPNQTAQPNQVASPNQPAPPQALPVPGMPTGMPTTMPSAMPTTQPLAVVPQTAVNVIAPNAGDVLANNPAGVAGNMMQPQFPYPQMMPGMPGAMMQGGYPGMQGGYPMMAPQTSLTPYDIALLVSMLKNNSRRDAMRERRTEKRTATHSSSDPLSVFMEAWCTPTTPTGVTARMPSKNAYPWGYFGGQSAPQSTPNFGGYYNNTFNTTTQPGM